MRHRTHLISIILVLSILSILNCNKNETVSTELATPLLPQVDYDYNASNSSGMPVDNKIAKLGRVLFYDKKLSFNNRVACASCHKQGYGFADNVAHSEGYFSEKTPRNSIGIINLSKSNSLFWDGRENQLDSMVLKPILNHIEMGINNLGDVEAKIKDYDYYKTLFTEAYGDETVSSERIGRALGEFTQSIRSTSNFNKYISNLANSSGGKLFTKYQCNNCHFLGESNVSWGSGFANTGLDLNSEDKGVGGLKGMEFLEGAFKIPSLINVGLTAPYMHDGRFNTLEEVIDHYSHGIKPSKNLDFRLQEGMDDFLFTTVNTLIFQEQNKNRDIVPRNAKITELDKKILVDFLKSLVDKELINDAKYSNPFTVKK